MQKWNGWPYVVVGETARGRKLRRRATAWPEDRAVARRLRQAQQRARNLVLR